MIIVPISAPAAVHTYGSFDYVVADPARHRIYAAHTSAKRLLILDATSGKEVGQVDVGPMHGVAVDESTGIVFTGDGTDEKVSKVDPSTLKVLAETNVPGPVDAIAYDPATHRIYADEDSGTDVYVIDSRSMKLVGSVRLPGHDEEYLAVDPHTHVVYQNVPDKNEFVEIDPATLHVSKVVPTPELTDDHPLQYDARLDEIAVGGKNGVISAYTPAGKLLGSATYPAGVDQCSLDSSNDRLACAGNGTVALLQLEPAAAPRLLATLPTHAGIHTLAIDPSTHDVWAVWGSAAGDFVRRFALRQ